MSTIFGWAFFSFWSAIPAGVALNVAPFWVALTVTISYGSGVALVLIVGAPLRERIRRRMPDAGKPNRTLQTIQRGWDRFGLLGLAILAPMTVGAQVGTVIGLSFGVRPVRLLVAMTLGAAAWGVLITLAVVLGVVTVSSAL